MAWPKRAQPWMARSLCDSCTMIGIMQKHPSVEVSFGQTTLYVVDDVDAIWASTRPPDDSCHGPFFVTSNALW
jgi:hypothetical protein